MQIMLKNLLILLNEVTLLRCEESLDVTSNPNKLIWIP